MRNPSRLTLYHKIAEEGVSRVVGTHLAGVPSLHAADGVCSLGGRFVPSWERIRKVTHKRKKGLGFPHLVQPTHGYVSEIFSPLDIFNAKLGLSPGYPEGDPYHHHRAGTVQSLAHIKWGTCLGVSL